MYKNEEKLLTKENNMVHTDDCKQNPGFLYFEDKRDIFYGLVTWLKAFESLNSLSMSE